MEYISVHATVPFAEGVTALIADQVLFKVVFSFRSDMRRFVEDGPDAAVVAHAINMLLP